MLDSQRLFSGDICPLKSPPPLATGFTRNVQTGSIIEA
jgi:hypothetical protein